MESGKVMPVKVPFINQIDLFVNHLQFVGPFVQKKKKKKKEKKRQQYY